MNLRIVRKNHAAVPEIGFAQNRFHNLRPCRQHWS